MGKRKEKNRVREKGRRAEDGGGEKKKRRRRERKRGKSGRKSSLKAARETFFLLEKHRGGAARASPIGQAGPAASTRHYSAAEFYSPMKRKTGRHRRERRKKDYDIDSALPYVCVSCLLQPQLHAPSGVVHADGNI